MPNYVIAKSHFWYCVSAEENEVFLGNCVLWAVQEIPTVGEELQHLAELGPPQRRPQHVLGVRGPDLQGHCYLVLRRGGGPALCPRPLNPDHEGKRDHSQQVPSKFKGDRGGGCVDLRSAAPCTYWKERN